MLVQSSEPLPSAPRHRQEAAQMESHFMAIMAAASRESLRLRMLPGPLPKICWTTKDALGCTMEIEKQAGATAVQVAPQVHRVQGGPGR